jgi:hypothetical protein
MVRTITPTKVPLGKIRFENIGGTHRTADGTVIKHGEILVAYPGEIPPSFMDKFKPLDDLPVVAESSLEVVKQIYSLKDRSAGWFDIIDGNGKRVNEKPMIKADAEAVLAKLG